MDTGRERANTALAVTLVAFIFTCVFTLMLNHKIVELEDAQPEIETSITVTTVSIGTALTCEQIQGVVVCVER